MQYNNATMNYLKDTKTNLFIKVFWQTINSENEKSIFLHIDFSENLQTIADCE